MTSWGMSEHPSRPFLDQILCEHSGGLVRRTTKYALKCNAHKVYALCCVRAKSQRPASEEFVKVGDCLIPETLRGSTINLLPRQAVGLGAPRTIFRWVCVCHHGHFKALCGCRLVGSMCNLAGENLFTQACDHVCTFDTVTGNLAVNSVFVTIISKWLSELFATEDRTCAR